MCFSPLGRSLSVIFVNILWVRSEYSFSQRDSHLDPTLGASQPRVTQMSQREELRLLDRAQNLVSTLHVKEKKNEHMCTVGVQSTLLLAQVPKTHLGASQPASLSAYTTVSTVQDLPENERNTQMRVRQNN